MKRLILIVFSLSVTNLQSQEVIMFKKRRKRVNHTKSKVVLNDKASTKKSVIKKKDGKITALKKHNELLVKKLNAYKIMALTRIDSMSVWESGPKLRRGDMIPGELMLSVLSTNMGSPIIVDVTHTSLPGGGKILCTGTTKHKRVMAYCDTLITPYDEIEINATLLDADGSHGMMGKISTGKEKYLAGIAMSEMAQGALTIMQDRTKTINGSFTNPSAKNAILQGLANTGNSATDIMKESMTTEEPKVFIQRGKRVIVFFNKTVRMDNGES